MKSPLWPSHPLALVSGNVIAIFLSVSQWYLSVTPASLEAEAGGWLEVELGVELYLGQRRESLFHKQTKKPSNKIKTNPQTKSK